MKRLTPILLLIAAFACYTFSAYAQDPEHKWLTYSMEVKMPGVSQEELFDRCGYIRLIDDNLYSCHWDFDSHIKEYRINSRPFSLGNRNYEISYKVLIYVEKEKYIIELGFIKTYIVDGFKQRKHIEKFQYMTEGTDGVRGGIAHATYKFHDKNIRENYLPSLFNEISSSIKADMMIPRR